MTDDEEVPGRHPIFLFFFANIKLLCVAAFGWLVFSVWLSVREDDWQWFSRSGAVLGIAGAVLACRGTLRLSRQERIGIRNMTLVQRFTREELDDQERDSQAAVAGVLLLVAGTLIWAYGDLIGA